MKKTTRFKTNKIDTSALNKFVNDIKTGKSIEALYELESNDLTLKALHILSKRLGTKKS